MIVVADASPLHYLILVEQIELLVQLYSRVLIPDTVWGELQHSHTPVAVREWVAHAPAWLEVKPAQGSYDDALKALDPGERDAIGLALALSIDTLPIDEVRGRREAEIRHVHVTGTLGILERGAERGVLDLPSVLARLLGLNFRVHQRIIDGLLARNSERMRKRS